MPNEPTSLREALKEAVEELVHLTEDFLPHDTYAEAEWIDQIGRVNALIALSTSPPTSRSPMPDEPKPLREALREAVDTLDERSYRAGAAVERSTEREIEQDLQACDVLRAKVYRLIEHIPIDVEANDD